MRQNQNLQKLESEYELLQKRLTALDIQPQTGQDEEKTKLASQLANANMNLIKVDSDKLKLELKDSNQQWLWGWTGFFGVMFAVFGVALWFIIKSLIADRVEGHLKGFQEAFDQVNELKNELGILEKEHTISLLENFNNPILWHEKDHPEQIRELKNEVLLDVFSDKTRYIGIRVAAIEVMGARGSQIFFNPVLTYLDSIVDSEIDWEASREPDYYLRRLLARLSGIHNEESYQGIKSFLNQMINENPKNINLFLPWTVFALSEISIVMGLRDSIDVMKKVIPEMKELKPNAAVMQTLAEYFDKFGEYEGIEEILTNGLTESMLEVEKRCLELLQEHDPKFVREWKEVKEETNEENEETDESEPTT